MLEKWEKTLDKGGFLYAMFIVLWKALNTRDHDLLLGKLGAYYQVSNRRGVCNSRGGWKNIKN